MVAVGLMSLVFYYLEQRHLVRIYLIVYGLFNLVRITQTQSGALHCEIFTLCIFL